MTIAVVVAHTPWRPHTGGGSTCNWSEYGLSATVSALVGGALRDVGETTDIVQMPERVMCADGSQYIFRCSGDHSHRASCERYNAGLRWSAREARRIAGTDGLALSFHFGRGRPGWDGPLCLVNPGPVAAVWATGYLASWRRLHGDPGRGVWELPKHRKLFPRNPCFLRDGPRDAVLIEMGNAASATDCSLFDDGIGLDLVPQAAAEATRSLLS